MRMMKNEGDDEWGWWYNTDSENNTTHLIFLFEFVRRIQKEEKG